MQNLFLGVDGGQSSTTALIGDENGRILGSGRGGPCNHVKTGDGREKFVNAISGCVGAACLQAGLDPAAFEGLAFRHFFLQPMFGPSVEAFRHQAVEYCLQHPRWRLSLQVHKYLGIK